MLPKYFLSIERRISKQVDAIASIVLGLRLFFAVKKTRSFSGSHGRTKVAFGGQRAYFSPHHSLEYGGTVW